MAAGPGPQPNDTWLTTDSVPLGSHSQGPTPMLILFMTEPCGQLKVLCGPSYQPAVAWGQNTCRRRREACGNMTR